MPFVIDASAKKQLPQSEADAMLADVKNLMSHMLTCPTCGSAFMLAELQARRCMSQGAEKQKQQQGGGSP